LQELNFDGTKSKKIKFFLNIFKVGRKSDYILIPKEAQWFVFLLVLFKIFNSKVKIIFDAFISFYDTKVFDRKLVEENSLKAKYYYLLDYLLCRFSDILFFDTIEHRNYFVKTFKINKNKKLFILPMVLDIDLIDRVVVSENVKSIFNKEKFNVFFYGSYIPLQGVENIIKAANILKEKKDIQFVLLGGGQTFPEAKKIHNDFDLKNIIFVDRKPYKELLEYIKASDLCLGIFGGTDKAKRVVSNKVLEYLVCSKQTITGRSSAMERHFEDKKDLIYCNMADSEDLAKKIEYMYNNYEELKYLGENGRGVVERYFSEENITNIINNELK
jgi:glycosyltransferase involved in cell wall biosynthesis